MADNFSVSMKTLYSKDKKKMASKAVYLKITTMVRIKVENIHYKYTKNLKIVISNDM